ncbi:RNA polymerase II large subunit [Artemisia annua]|uniref:RNA polymerase II large subunit n=1 Tax=Artemisia annua TaxID=35608 RepID=A0A2U1KRN0_ARTAN|nr:RNA polymerase II large subunit [Artemisia annua]
MWYDWWSDVGPLCDIISNDRILEAGLSLECTVLDMISNCNWNWPSQWVTKFPVLKDINVPVLTNMEDKAVWKTNENKKVDFCIKAAWGDLRDNDMEVQWSKLVWYSQAGCDSCFQFMNSQMEDYKFKQALRIRNPKNRLKKILDACKSKSTCECGDDIQSINPDGVNTVKKSHGGCGALQPTITIDGMKWLRSTSFLRRKTLTYDSFLSRLKENIFRQKGYHHVYIFLGLSLVLSSYNGEDVLVLLDDTMGDTIMSWSYLLPIIRYWRSQEGNPSKRELGESSASLPKILPVTGEPIHYTIPLLATGIARHEDRLNDIVNVINGLPCGHITEDANNLIIGQMAVESKVEQIKTDFSESMEFIAALCSANVTMGDVLTSFDHELEQISAQNFSLRRAIQESYARERTRDRSIETLTTKITELQRRMDEVSGKP